MKKETIYSIILLGINVLVLLLERFSAKWIFAFWNKHLDNQPLPELTGWIQNISGIWPFIFIFSFLVILLLSIKYEKVAFHMIMLFVIFEILFLAVVAASYIIPAYNEFNPAIFGG